jgi:5-methylcytosine-specific restriction endonuclease McrA
MTIRGESARSGRGEYLRNYQKPWIRARRDAFIESRGGVCVKCGSADRLEVDHIDRNKKTMRASSIWSRNQTSQVVLDELANCQVLCHDCHQQKTNAERRAHITEHGTYAMYKTVGCRCEPCTKENALRVREQRAARKSKLAEGS